MRLGTEPADPETHVNKRNRAHYTLHGGSLKAGWLIVGAPDENRAYAETSPLSSTRDYRTAPTAALKVLAGIPLLECKH